MNYSDVKGKPIFHFVLLKNKEIQMLKYLRIDYQKRYYFLPHSP